MTQSNSITIGTTLLRWGYGLLLGLLATAVLNPAEATCPAARQLTSLNAPDLSYIYTPGVCDNGLPCPTGSSVTADLQGSFWALGAGDPNLGSGNDNGSYAALIQGAVPGEFSAGWVIAYANYNYPAWIQGSWSVDGGIDGCVDSAPQACTAVLLSDQRSGRGYFAYLTAAADGAGMYDFSQAGSASIGLVEIPDVSILSTQGGNDLTATVQNAAVPATGFFLDGDARCNGDSVIGYKVYEQTVPRGGAAPISRDPADGWNVADGGQQPSGDPIPLGDPTSLTLSCPSIDSDTFLALQLFFDSGFTTYLSASDARIAVTPGSNCQPTEDTDGDGTPDFFDCAPDDPAISVGGEQVCGDGKNNDCDHPNWPALTGTNEVDDDGDGFSECAGDCNDMSLVIFPGAGQICDGINNDCNDPNWPTVPANEANDDGDAWRICNGDCDDDDATTFPFAAQACDGVNNTCNDPNWPTVPPNEVDDDGDGFFECQGDCDDGAMDVFPGANEICNGIDDDCDTLTDEAPNGLDRDGDNVPGACDNCPDTFNFSQQDTDGDGLGNSCDNCEFAVNLDQTDADDDGRGDACDNCPIDFNLFQDDFDEDGVGNACDNCEFAFNPGQADFDSDFEGDICDTDDGVVVLFFTDPGFVDWQDDTVVDAYNSYRGDLLELLAGGDFTQAPGSNPTASQTCGLTAPFIADPFFPAPGEVAFYLTTPISGGIEGALGDGAGVNRGNTNPCP